MRTWAVVVAGGTGTRFGGLKQFSPLRGRPVAAWSVEAARSVAEGVVLVVPAGSAEVGDTCGADVVVPGGDTRSASVRAGLSVIPEDVGVVVVHDAARPLASPDLFRAVVRAVDGTGSVEQAPDGAVPGVAVSDTLKRVEHGLVVGTVDREAVVAVQTPQAFRAASLRAAHQAGGTATDDAGLVESFGGIVRVVPGEPWNLKVTLPSDLAVADLLVAR